MFVYAIRQFEKTHILLNDKIPFNRKCSLPWLTDGVEDVSFGTESTNVFDFLSTDPEKPSVKTSIVTPWTVQNTCRVKNVRKKINKFNKSISDTEFENSDDENENTFASSDNEDDVYDEVQLLHNDLKLPLVGRVMSTKLSVAFQNRITKRLNDELFDQTDDPVFQKTTKRSLIDVYSKSNKITKYSTDNDIDKANIKSLTLGQNELLKTINGIKTFGSQSNKALNTCLRTRHVCCLCLVNSTKSQNLIISDDYAVSCCVQ